MTEFRGKPVFSGIAIGKIAILKKDDQSVKRTHVEDTAGELARVTEAKEKALGQLKALYEKAVKEVGESGSAQEYSSSSPGSPYGNWKNRIG